MSEVTINSLVTPKLTIFLYVQAYVIRYDIVGVIAEDKEVSVV